MTNFRKILVGMSYTPQDIKIAHYLNHMAHMFDIHKICDVHVFTSEYLFQELNNYYPGLGYESLKKLEENMNERLESSYSNIENTENEVVVGAPLQQLKKKTETWAPDLIALGKRENGHTTLAKNVIRHIECNALIVPEKSPHTISNILVPVDLSDHSGNILQAAMDIQRRANENIKITCLHVYDIPHFPSYGGENMQRAIEKHFKSKTEDTFDHFFNVYASEEKNKSNIKKVLELGDRPSDNILKFIDTKKFDLMVMGTKTHSDFQGFLGSTAEQVISKNEKVPLLIIK